MAGMAPRIAPKDVADCDERTAKLMTGTLRSPDGEALNIFRTMAHHPGVFRRFMAFGSELLLTGNLPARERELLILRTGWNCQSEYEWGQHVAIGLRSNLTEDDIRRIKEGPKADWGAADAALLQAADELHSDNVVSDATWATLAATYDEQSLIEIVSIVGFYHFVAFFLNSTGTEREAGVVGLDAP
jgi:alkylhydroperoxidase family enzyme